MSATELQEHFDHTTPGDFLFLASSICDHVDNDDDQSKNEDESDDEFEVEAAGGEWIPREVAPKIVFHLLCSAIDIENNLIIPSMSSSTIESVAITKKLLAMCCSGRCCDPDFQNAGIATIVHNIAVSFLKPQLVVTRTVNPSILKLLRRNSPPGSKLFPNDSSYYRRRCGRGGDGNKNSDENADANRDENAEEEEWKMVRNIGAIIVQKWDHFENQRDKYNPETLQFEGVYQNVDPEVFGANSDVVENLDMEVKRGDAQLRIVVFP